MTRWGKIVSTVRDRLQGIRQASGYLTDMGDLVRPVAVNIDPLDVDQLSQELGVDRIKQGITLQSIPGDPGSGDENRQIGRVHNKLVVFDQELAIYGFSSIAGQEEWFDESQRVLADLKRAIFGETFPTAALGIKSITIGTSETVTSGAGDRFAAAHLPLLIRYAENLAKSWQE